MADSALDEALRRIDELIHQSERLREVVEDQLRRRPSWPERGQQPPDPRHPAESPGRQPTVEDQD